MTPPPLPTASLRTLLVTVAVCSALSLLYATAEMEPHPLVSLTILVAPVIAAVYWIRADARLRRIPLVHDMGLFLWFAWPVLIPWYAIHTRGRHAFALGILIVVAILTPVLVAWLVEVLRTFSSRGL